MIIDLTPVRDRTGPSRLLDIVPGRSKQVFTTWLQAQTATFRDGIQTVAMDGFTGFKDRRRRPAARRHRRDGSLPRRGLGR